MGWFTSAKANDEVKGLYLYGGVGCGKTFIMDLFFACVPIEKKRRSHFHSFMLEIHQRLHMIRQSGKGRADVATVAEDVVRESGEVFCFDEFNVTDVSRAPPTRPRPRDSTQHITSRTGCLSFAAQHAIVAIWRHTHQRC